MDPELDFRLLPQIDAPIIDSLVYTFTVDNWEATKTEHEKIRSPEFICGGFRWRILLFPSGNKQNEVVSAFLESVDAQMQDKDSRWYTCVQFGLAAQSVQHPNNFHFQHAHHRFNPGEIDWGFNQFVKFAALTDSKKPILENDKLNIVAVLRIVKDETGVLWHNFVDYNSKQETGFVGLRNQGATCYMNSLLQSLYFTNAFRKATFQIPTENDQPQNSIPLAIQRIFYNLQYSNDPVGTTELTRSFGWDTADSFMQHDVQEFNRVLQDTLETKMKNTPAEGAISDIFKGKTKSFIKCVNIDYESSRTEDFYDVQLNVKGCSDLVASFKEYCATETLDGDNMYMAEGHGLQVAKKGVIFTEFPKVFHMQLKRYEYDFERDMNVKINDRFEYPETIDLSEFINDKSENVFVLHGVLVHSGDVHGGHYCAFLKPSLKDEWFKFDDDRVVRVTKKEAIDDNFGGFYPKERQNRYKKFTNAYMLVYIKKSQLSKILDSVVDIPQHLIHRLEQERQLAIQKQKELDEEHLYVRFKLLLDKDVATNDGFDMFDFANRASELKEIRILKSSQFSDFKKHLSSICGIPAENFRLWPLVQRRNRTLRLLSPLVEKADTVEVVFEAFKDYREFYVYLEDQIDASPETSVLFIKYLNMETNTMDYLGKLNIRNSSKISDLIPWVTQKVGGFSFKAFEQVSPLVIEQVKLKQTFAAAELKDGDILCFQKDLSDSELERLPSHFFRDVPAYYDFIANRISVTFKNLQAQSVWPGEVVIDLSKKYSFDRIAKILADIIRLPDYQKIKLVNASMKQVKKNHLLQEMLSYVGFNKANIFYYDVLSVSVDELDSKRVLKGVLQNSLLQEKQTDQQIFSKTETVGNVVQKLFGEAGGVVYERNHHRIHRLLTSSDNLLTVADSSEIVMQQHPGDPFIPVFHFYKDIGRTHGTPFLIQLRNEPFAQVKERILKLIGEREASKIKFALVVNNCLVKYLEDGGNFKIIVDILDIKSEIGLEHAEKNSFFKTSMHEKAIKFLSG